MRKESGISLLEVVIALAIVMLVLYAAITFFIGSVRQYKVQTKIIETNVEGVLGLELLRRDVESLGFGLHWNDGVPYTERTAGAAQAVALTDSPAAPRPVVSINGAASTVNGSDYLVIRSARVGRSDAAGKWTTLRTGSVTRDWGSAEENLSSGDQVIVIAPGGVNQDRRTLLTLAAGTPFTSTGPSGFAPIDPAQVHIVYGIDDGPLARPFNRAEYFIDNASVTVPPRCAPNTGVLVKAVVRHDTGTTPASELLPLLDCVADLQVVYMLDTDGNPSTPPIPSDDISGMTADAIRAQLKEVRLHILAQEGQRDDNFRYPSASVLVGPDNAVGRNFDVSGTRNYRWKAYSIVVKPRNLAN
ncbi:MAG TPA: prepilin-type N-terminal cleavage/methylation domain-containing protein [Candidatus Deferrimicrobiaceae bacterium]